MPSPPLDTEKVRLAWHRCACRRTADTLTYLHLFYAHSPILSYFTHSPILCTLICFTHSHRMLLYMLTRLPVFFIFIHGSFPASFNRFGCSTHLFLFSLIFMQRFLRTFKRNEALVNPLIGSTTTERVKRVFYLVT